MIQKKHLYTLIVLLMGSKASAMEWKCDKKIEILRAGDSDSTRPYLVVKETVREDGTVAKLYKPLATANETVADKLMGIQENTLACIKYYDPLLPPPTPIMLIDISLENSTSP